MCVQSRSEVSGHTVDRDIPALITCPNLICLSLLLLPLCCVTSNRNDDNILYSVLFSRTGSGREAQNPPPLEKNKQERYTDLKKDFTGYTTLGSPTPFQILGAVSEHRRTFRPYDGPSSHMHLSIAEWSVALSDSPSCLLTPPRYSYTGLYRPVGLLGYSLCSGVFGGGGGVPGPHPPPWQ